jgi:hypothetical protein
MKQSRAMSLVESGANILVGYALAVGVQFAIFPWFGIRVGVVENLGIGLAFTAVSLVRSYALRRFFEHMRGRRWTKNTRLTGF